MRIPDDEVLWGYPILQDRQHDLALLTCCANTHKGSGPIQALREVCEANEIQWLGAPLGANQFYRLPTRYADATLMSAVTVLRRAIENAIADFQPEAIFTHNPWGEYGHGDHKLCFDLVSRLDQSLLLTDICLENKCHLSSKEPPMFWYDLFHYEASFALDLNWYERMKAIYEKHGAWTWGGHEPAKEASLYWF